jgi:protein-tyrosine kinase
MIHRTAQRPAGRTRNAPSPAAAPEYFSLIRNLAGQPGSPVIRSLGFTSSRSGEGVSTVALQCAIAAEQLFNQPILLVEANTERPALQRAMRLERGPGLGELLLDQEARQQCVQRYCDNLSVITAGSVAHSSLRRCSAESITRTVDVLQEGQRLTIWDLPAVGQDDLALELASQLDGVVLVVESERVMTDVAQTAANRLRSAGAKLLGAVLNKHREHVPGWLAGRL